MINPITNLTKKDLFEKKVLLRVDFNIPVEKGKISEIYRIKAVRETVDYLKNNGAIVVLASHVTALSSFDSIISRIKDILEVDFIFISDCIGEIVKSNIGSAKSGHVFLLDNLRKYEGEEKNDMEFAKKLAEPFDIYVNDAFATSHRNHASITAIAKLLPSYAGLLMMKEIENLDRILKLPKENKTLIIGGAKVETKLPVIENFLDKSENILIGGVVANIFLKTSGIDIKKSLSDDRFLIKAKEFLNNSAVTIPEDYVFSDDMILDIGSKTINKFSEIIKKSEIIVWNGPLGKSEIKELSHGTKEIAVAIVNSDAFSVVGGGDTIAFLEKNNLIDKFKYVSTGGGAMLEFLAGNKLPGLDILDYYGG